MAPDATTQAVACLTDPTQAAHLLDPLRARILALAREPTSATEIGRELELPRQRVNYHVHQLVDAGLLRPAGTRPRRGLTEKLYRATARAYVAAPQATGPIAPDPDDVRDGLSAAHLLALTSQVQGELAWFQQKGAQTHGERLRTLSISAELRFADQAQRTAFAEALQEAIVALVEAHTSPDTTLDGAPGPGEPYRLVLGVHPRPPQEVAA